MYFTRKTEIALNVLATYARKPCDALAYREIVMPSDVGAEEIKKTVSLLVRHGLLKRVSKTQVALATDPATVTIGALLRITQPDLVRPALRERLMNKNVLTLAVAASSLNFLRIADRYTVADFMAEHVAPTQHAVSVRRPAQDAYL